MLLTRGRTPKPQGPWRPARGAADPGPLVQARSLPVPRLFSAPVTPLAPASSARRECNRGRVAVALGPPPATTAETLRAAAPAGRGPQGRRGSRGSRRTKPVRRAAQPPGLPEAELRTDGSAEGPASRGSGFWRRLRSPADPGLPFSTTPRRPDTTGQRAAPGRTGRSGRPDGAADFLRETGFRRKDAGR